jgi:hypothetical protein
MYFIVFKRVGRNPKGLANYQSLEGHIQSSRSVSYDIGFLIRLRRRRRIKNPISYDITRNRMQTPQIKFLGQWFTNLYETAAQ